MNEHLNSNNDSQNKQETWEQYLVKITRPGYQSPPFKDVEVDWFPDDETTEEAIAKSLNNIDEGIGYLCSIEEQKLEAYRERAEAIMEHNHLGTKEENHQSSEGV